MAPNQCNDTPDDIPIFSGLSPQQRVRLVREVMIGMLCDDEPLPPNTIQHAPAYRALLEVLVTQIEVEIDMIDMHDINSEELILHDREESSKRRSEDELLERNAKFTAVEARARRVKKKMEKGNIVLVNGDVSDEEDGLDQIGRASCRERV